MDGRCPGDGAAGDLRGGGTVTSPLLNTCQVCGAEESLDAMLARMIDDGEVRRLIADVVTRSMVLGGHVAGVCGGCVIHAWFDGLLLRAAFCLCR